MKAYAIKDWGELFENNRSREIKKLRYLIVPLRNEGKGYRRMLRQPNKVELYAAWRLLLEVAAKMPIRGILANEHGKLEPSDLEDETDFPAEMFEKALQFFSDKKVAWLIEIDIPQNSEKSADEVRDGDDRVRDFAHCTVRYGTPVLNVNKPVGKSADVVPTPADNPATATLQRTAPGFSPRADRTEPDRTWAKRAAMIFFQQVRVPNEEAEGQKQSTVAQFAKISMDPDRVKLATEFTEIAKKKRGSPGIKFWRVWQAMTDEIINQRAQSAAR